MVFYFFFSSISRIFGLMPDKAFYFFSQLTYGSAPNPSKTQSKTRKKFCQNTLDPREVLIQWLCGRSVAMAGKKKYPFKKKTGVLPDRLAGMT